MRCPEKKRPPVKERVHLLSVPHVHDPQSRYRVSTRASEVPSSLVVAKLPRFHAFHVRHPSSVFPSLSLSLPFPSSPIRRRDEGRRERARKKGRGSPLNLKSRVKRCVIQIHTGGSLVIITRTPSALPPPLSDGVARRIYRGLRNMFPNPRAHAYVGLDSPTGIGGLLSAIS